jgi:hypothetical protein
VMVNIEQLGEMPVGCTCHKWALSLMRPLGGGGRGERGYGQILNDNL